MCGQQKVERVVKQGASRSVVQTGAATRLRGIVVMSALGVLAAWATPAQAGESCNAPDAKGSIACTAGLHEDRIREIAITQDKSQWCWAASISMIFASHGFRLPQEAIVKDITGKLEDVNAPSGEAMTNALRRKWRSPESHQEVATSAKVGDIAANRFEISNAAIADELAEGRPLLIGTRGHAMVLVKANYERRTNGDVIITGGTVIDPLPGKGVRKLARGEMILSYVAAVQVAGIKPHAPSNTLASADTEEEDEDDVNTPVYARRPTSGPTYAGPSLKRGRTCHSGQGKQGRLLPTNPTIRPTHPRLRLVGPNL